ncbi:MAG: ferritin-like domain-containing protein [Christensenellales bacterium]|jgi:bacterioferritin
MLREDLPYPPLDGLSTDIESARIISPAYTSLYVSEMTAALQYMYHYFFFDAMKMEEFAHTVEEIAITEMMHKEILGKTLLRLGIDPIFSVTPPFRNYYNTSKVSYSKTPERMLRDDIQAEIYAIEDYERMLMRLNNEQVKAIIARIQLDEKLHLNEFKKLLNMLHSE